MLRKMREYLSLYLTKRTSVVLIVAILLCNFVFVTLAGTVIFLIAPGRFNGVFDAILTSIKMVLDAGFMTDVRDPDITITLVSISVIIIGMILFTGATIGYATNILSDFIDKARSGSMSLHISDHIVMLNWNTRAAEIINELLYARQKETIVILVDENKKGVETDIANRISDTLRKETEERRIRKHDYHGIDRLKYLWRSRIDTRKLTIIVRECEIYSTKSLADVSLERAKMVIILGKDLQNSQCKYDIRERLENRDRGNSRTVKALIQVADYPVDEKYRDVQKIIVEIDDNWTGELVEMIVRNKRDGRVNNIYPLYVNRVLGQILSQFSIMPELNNVYNTLFSNKGASFYTDRLVDDGTDYVRSGLTGDLTSLPLAAADDRGSRRLVFMADSEKDVRIKVPYENQSDFSVQVNTAYKLPKKNIIILGHNSRSRYIMQGFDSLRSEWKSRDGEEVLDIIAIDDEKSLEKLGEYPYLRKMPVRDIYDREMIYSLIESFVDSHTDDTSVLILSDDSTTVDEFDASALTYLIYIQDIIRKRNYDRGRVDIVIEILNPKNYDVVHSYSVDNVIISNRYVSKMVTQIGKDSALFSFYDDILTYDDAEVGDDASNEIYIKECSRFLRSIPDPCNAAQLVLAVYDASAEDNRAITLGYVNEEGEVILFSGNREDIPVTLNERCKLIVFSKH